jgi:prolyl-tRNA synthetase
MRTRLFLRTTEFLWQEGHTAHATAEEAEEETLRMLNIYQTFAQDYAAIPVMIGRKSEREKFAGALHTYTIEALMQDGKALQAGTSHNLGQNFAKAFDVTFQDQQGTQQLVYATSWGMSTRMIGALIMTHGDDQGLILPPRLAPLAVVLIPIFKGKEDHGKILEFLKQIGASLDADVTYRLDAREEYTPGWKFNEWERLGVPIRIEAGPRDLQREEVVVVRRDTGEKISVAKDSVGEKVRELLKDIQTSLYDRALKFRNENTTNVDNYQTFREVVNDQGGFLYAHWCGNAECEDQIKQETMATIRCIPLQSEGDGGGCVRCGEGSGKRVYFAKAY